MSCCGKIKNIVAGTAKRLLSPSELARHRLEICDRCEFQTWLLPHEYAVWLAGHGIEVRKNFTQLEKLPDLPKKEYRPLAGKYCMRCKCALNGKVRENGEICTEKMWDMLLEGSTMEITAEERKRRWKICRNCGDNQLGGTPGICDRARAFLPTRTKEPSRQQTVELPSGDSIVIEGEVDSCLAGKWDLTGP